MKSKIIVLIILTAFVCLLLGQTYPINLELTGGGFNGSGFFNSIKAASIDVDNPNVQPLIFTLRINKTGSQTITEGNIYFNLTWNNIPIITDNYSPLKPLALTMLNNNQMIMVNNKALISETGNSLIGASEPSMSLSDFLSNENFDTAIRNTGLFPDGNYQFKMQVKKGNEILSNEAIFTMTIQNVNNITLIGPGAQAGSTIPIISSRPILFSWFSNITNNAANPYALEIREYSQLNTMDMGNLGNCGTLFYSANSLINPIFNQNLPFMESNYYAWKVSVPLITDQTEFGQANAIESQWYVFKFGSASNNPVPNPYQEILNAIQNIQNPTILQYINQGYLPTGRILFNGNNVSQAQLMSILPQILNSTNVTIEVVD